MEKIKRKNRESIINALTEAQKLAFAPMAFCALSSGLDLGIIEYLDKNSKSTKEQMMTSLKLDDYTVETLMQALVINNIAHKEVDKYSLTKMGKLFLYDDMTKANFHFIKDVCYLGANELAESFKDRKPKGLHKFLKNYETIYPALTVLPDKMRKSWYEFDHLYSDICFEEVFSIITEKYSSIFDIGGNTGKFEAVCLKNNKNIDVTMLDLKENIVKAKGDTKLKNCKFHPVNVLDKEPNYPDFKNSAVLMSQFLDCFSKSDIVKILTDLAKKLDDSSSIYILEPYTDMQKFFGAEYSLVHASLYFTCMANGVSKFYTLKEMKEMIEKSNLVITKQFNDIGIYNYTLLKVAKK